MTGSWLMKARVTSMPSPRQRASRRGALTTPYDSAPERAFWRRAVSSKDAKTLLIGNPPTWLDRTTRIVTAGSCFAQHIGRHLRSEGFLLIDAEPAPSVVPRPLWEQFGYGLYSARYGNIYSARQLLQLLEEALGRRSMRTIIWRDAVGRHYDALRPSISPGGLSSEEQIRTSRSHHLNRIAGALESADAFVFTLGLTECWIDTESGSALPSAPGVFAGSFELRKAAFHNFNYDEVLSDLEDACKLLWSVNSRMSILLTVSPVPLVATATGDHVVVASMHSKAILRAAAGALAVAHPQVTYFPSYEIIQTPPYGVRYFEPDLRSVSAAGIDAVMHQLFRDSESTSTGDRLPASNSSEDDVEASVICDEEALEEIASQIDIPT
mgnify:CR=1 FL=1